MVPLKTMTCESAPALLISSTKAETSVSDVVSSPYPTDCVFTVPFKPSSLLEL
jgi:hypothetical protein